MDDISLMEILGTFDYDPLWVADVSPSSIMYDRLLNNWYKGNAGHSRHYSSLGRLIRRGLKINVKDEYLTKISERVKEVLTAVDARIAEGNEIYEVYDNHSVASCMTGKDKGILSLYCNNPDKVKLAFTDRSRALIWFAGEDIYVDRIYGLSNTDKTLLEESILKKYPSAVIRQHNGLLDDEEDRKYLWKDTPVTLKLKSPDTDARGNRLYPYLDTLSFVKDDEGGEVSITNDHFECFPMMATRTNGYLNEVEYCRVCGGVMDEEYADGICERCADEGYRACEHCGEPHLTDDLVPILTNNWTRWYCDSCTEKLFSFCVEHDTYYEKELSNCPICCRAEERRILEETRTAEGYVLQGVNFKNAHCAIREAPSVKISQCSHLPRFEWCETVPSEIRVTDSDSVDVTVSSFTRVGSAVHKVLIDVQEQAALCFGSGVAVDDIKVNGANDVVIVVRHFCNNLTISNFSRLDLRLTPSLRHVGILKNVDIVESRKIKADINLIRCSVKNLNISLVNEGSTGDICVYNSAIRNSNLSARSNTRLNIGRCIVMDSVIELNWWNIYKHRNSFFEKCHIRINKEYVGFEDPDSRSVFKDCIVHLPSHNSSRDEFRRSNTLINCTIVPEV